MPRSAPGMMIRSSRHRLAAETGKSCASRFAVTSPILGSVGSSRSRLVIAWIPGSSRASETRARRGLDHEGRLRAGDEIVAAAEATKFEFGLGQSRRRLGTVEAEQIDGQQAPRARLILPGQLTIATVSHGHGNPGLVDSQPGAHLGERPVRSVVGARQQAAERPDPAADGRRHRPAPRLLAIGPNHNRGAPLDPVTDEDQAHGIHLPRRLVFARKPPILHHAENDTTSQDGVHWDDRWNKMNRGLVAPGVGLLHDGSNISIGISMRSYRIAVIPGDGIGKEVVPEGLRVLEKAAARFRSRPRIRSIRVRKLRLLPEARRDAPDDWKGLIGGHDAIFYGAVGWPAKVPDHISLWGSLIQFRREFDQYVNLRPVRLMPGVPCPLADRRPGDIDFFVVRENTEGEYSAVGGRMFAGTEREFVVQEAIFTRTGVDRILRFAFELARSRPKKHLTSCTKSNGISISMPFWDERVEAMMREYPDVRRRPLPRRHPDCALRPQPTLVRCGRRKQPVRGHPLRPGPGLHRDDRHRALSEPQPDAQVPVTVRTGPRQRPGYRRPGHRQSDRPDLVRGHDA